MRPLIRLLRLPVDDYLAALAAFVARFRAPHLAVLALAAALSWWIYVPIHELLHAGGCLLGGGTVTRLEIDPIYGATLLQPIFPWVAVGSDYAGQLTGFDTGGSDAVYLLTDFLPFVLTIVIGVPMLRAAAHWPGTGLAQAALFGAALPIALAPFVSLTGDYYEMGSILVSRLAALVTPGATVARWRSDDVLKLTGELFGAGGSGSGGDAAGIAASFLLGTLLALLTYAVGAVAARAMRPTGHR